ncbi:beta-ketoacyl-[acyl-carrier-protein] synthase family protein [Amycolatopsis sp. NPDC051716]|uniref:beta-ketoacyl-[acyl-carrier-protein] synthase family protein n=1 Tax=Amycolatopsis sp. NPDC051716 TaxID=3155804 RepID=UPI00342F5D5A
MADRDIVVTGMAWTTALGTGVDAVWSALLAGETGIRPVASGFPLRNTAAAAVGDPPLTDGPDRRQRVLTERTVLRALGDAGVEASDPRVQAVLGTSYGSHLDTPAPSSLSRWCTEVTTGIGMVRAPLSISTACSAGADAILVATELIRDGVADICVCGGTDVLTPAKRLAHSAMGTMSPTSLRAFDESHDGTLLGEGSAVLVLESGRSARARGARPHGKVIGVGSSNDAQGATAPDPSGESVARAVRRALARSGRTLADVGVINAHGSGTPVNDTTELTGYSRLFDGAAGPPTLFATKGAFGHSLGATGAIEAITVLLALRDNVVPPVLGLAKPRPGWPFPVGGPAPVRGGVGLSVTLGFGGFNTCLALEGNR